MMHHPPLITGRIFFFFLMTMTLTLGNECRLGENDRKLPVSVRDVGYLETGAGKMEKADPKEVTNTLCFLTFRALVENTEL